MANLSPLLQLKEYNGWGHKPVAVEDIVASGLRSLSGARPKDQCFIFGSYKDVAY
jgi:hypothetical protein